MSSSRRKSSSAATGTGGVVCLDRSSAQRRFGLSIAFATLLARLGKEARAYFGDTTNLVIDLVEGGRLADKVDVGHQTLHVRQPKFAANLLRRRDSLRIGRMSIDSFVVTVVVEQAIVAILSWYHHLETAAFLETRQAQIIDDCFVHAAQILLVTAVRSHNSRHQHFELAASLGHISRGHIVQICAIVERGTILVIGVDQVIEADTLRSFRLLCTARRQFATIGRLEQHDD